MTRAAIAELQALTGISTVRIGAGAWHPCQACVPAATPVDQPHATDSGISPAPTAEKGITGKMNQ